MRRSGLFGTPLIRPWGYHVRTTILPQVVLSYIIHDEMSLGYLIQAEHLRWNFQRPIHDLLRDLVD